jgi:single-strand DNA-binding protein
MNVVVLQGSLSSDPVVRVLPSGSLLMSLEVSTEVQGARVGVPVAWFDPATEPAWARGDEVVVRGVVRRRFFATPGGAQSRTEVVASEVVAATSRRAVGALLRRSTAELGGAGVSREGASRGRSVASA